MAERVPLIAVCQHPYSDCSWFPVDAPPERCVEGGCDCTPAVYVLAEVTVEMVERAARALYEQRGYSTPWAALDSECDHQTINDVRLDARAALEAALSPDGHDTKEQQP